MYTNVSIECYWYIIKIQKNLALKYIVFQYHFDHNKMGNGL